MCRGRSAQEGRQKREACSTKEVWACAGSRADYFTIFERHAVAAEATLVEFAWRCRGTQGRV